MRHKPRVVVISILFFCIGSHADTLETSRIRTSVTTNIVARAVPSIRFQVLPSTTSRSNGIQINTTSDSTIVGVTASAAADVWIKDQKTLDQFFGHHLSMALLSTHQTSKNISIQVRALDPFKKRNFVSFGHSKTLSVRDLVPVEQDFFTIASVPSNSVQCGHFFPDMQTKKSISCKNARTQQRMDLTQFVRKGRREDNNLVSGELEYIALAE